MKTAQTRWKEVLPQQELLDFHPLLPICHHWASQIQRQDQNRQRLVGNMKQNSTFDAFREQTGRRIVMWPSLPQAKSSESAIVSLRETYSRKTTKDARGTEPNTTSPKTNTDLYN